MSAIEIDGLTKRFGGIVAVDGLDLTVEEGEIFGFLGPNGAGKSKTIDTLLDFIRPTAGSVTVLGHDAQRDGEAVRRRTGVLPDAYHVYDQLTGRQHVEFAIEMDGNQTLSDKEIREKYVRLTCIGRPASDYIRLVYNAKHLDYLQDRIM